MRSLVVDCAEYYLATIERVLCTECIYIIYYTHTHTQTHTHTHTYGGIWNKCSKLSIELRVILLAGVAGGAALNPN